MKHYIPDEYRCFYSHVIKTLGLAIRKLESPEEIAKQIDIFVYAEDLFWKYHPLVHPPWSKKVFLAGKLEDKKDLMGALSIAEWDYIKERSYLKLEDQRDIHNMIDFASWLYALPPEQSREAVLSILRKDDKAMKEHYKSIMRQEWKDFYRAE